MIRSLRAQLFAAIALVALLSLALALALGAILTRRAVERNTLRDVSAQFDLLAEREREALVPFSRLKSLQEFLDRQDERVVQLRLDGSSSLLRPIRRRGSGAAHGSTARCTTAGRATSTRRGSSTARASSSSGRRARPPRPGGRTSKGSLPPRS